MWNQKDLPQPPVISYKAHKHDLDLIKLRNALEEGMKHFKDSQLLSSEAALLSRILYRMKMKFRSAKDFKLLEKLCRCLEIYFTTNMARHLKNILDMTPSRYKIGTYLPTRNMLSYVLVRLQGLVKLMERIYNTCLIAATELNKRFSIGHFWKLFLILFGLVSRISILVKCNTKTICDLYGKLLPHSHRLENCGNDWLPHGYVLPTDLRAWLSVQWVYEDEFVDLTHEPVNEVMNFFNLVDDDEDDVEFCDEYILLDDEEKQIARDFRNLTPLKESLSRNRMRGFSINEDDIGEEITEVIEINDSILDPRYSEGSLARVLNTIHEYDHSEDIGEELCLSISGHPEKSVNLNKKLSAKMNISSKSRVHSSHAKENIDLVADNGSSNAKNDTNGSVIVLPDDTTSEVEEDSVIIVPGQSPGADDTVIFLDETVRQETFQASNSSIKKKKKSTRKLRSSSKENLQEADLTEVNKSNKKKNDISQYQTKTEAAAKRKLDFTETASNKKMKKLNGRSLDVNGIISAPPVKDICSSNKTILTPQFQLTSTTSQRENSVCEMASSQSDQSLRGTLMKKRRLRSGSQTEVKDLKKQKYENEVNRYHLWTPSKLKKIKSRSQKKRKLKRKDAIRNQKLKKSGERLSESNENVTLPNNKGKKTQLQLTSTTSQRENSVCEIASSQSDQSLRGTLMKKRRLRSGSQTEVKDLKKQEYENEVNRYHLWTPSKLKKIKSRNQKKRKLKCKDAIRNQKCKKSGERLSESNENVSLPTNKRKKTKNIEGPEKNKNEAPTVVVQNDVLKNKTTEHKKFDKKSLKRKKQVKAKLKQLEKLRTVKSCEAAVKESKKKSRKRKLKRSKKRSRKRASNGKNILLQKVN